MKIKGLFIMTMIICMLMNCAFGAEVPERTFLVEAAIELANWMENVENLQGLIEDEDSKYVIDVILDTLDCSIGIMLDATDLGNDLAKEDDRFEHVSPFHQVWNDLVYVESGVRWIESLNAFYEVSMRYDDNYTLIELTLYEKDKNLLGVQRIELGRREEETMLLLIDYDHINGLTGRFALFPVNNQGNIIYTKTLGKTLDIVLNVYDWVTGVDVVWDKQLLLPKMLHFSDK